MSSRVGPQTRSDLKPALAATACKSHYSTEPPPPNTSSVTSFFLCSAHLQAPAVNVGLQGIYTQRPLQPLRPDCGIFKKSWPLNVETGASERIRYIFTHSACTQQPNVTPFIINKSGKMSPNQKLIGTLQRDEAVTLTKGHNGTSVENLHSVNWRR